MNDYIYSLSEINAICKKAAKGAGLTWGQAEEIANASKQLAAYGIDVLKYLPGLLNNHLDKAETISKIICDVNDHCHLLKDKPRIYHNVPFPILLLPAVSQVALPLKTAFKVSADNLSAYVDCNGIYIEQGFAELESSHQLSIEKSLQNHQLIHASPAGLAISPAVWRDLNLLAARYFAPASEASRQNAGE